MPFKSEAQRRFMYARNPKMAKKWEKETPKGKTLPKRVSPLMDAYEKGARKLRRK
jgi:hypothetical protein